MNLLIKYYSSNLAVAQLWIFFFFWGGGKATGGLALSWGAQVFLCHFFNINIIFCGVTWGHWELGGCTPSPPPPPPVAMPLHPGCWCTRPFFFLFSTFPEIKYFTCKTVQKCVPFLQIFWLNANIFNRSMASLKKKIRRVLFNIK